MFKVQQRTFCVDFIQHHSNMTFPVFIKDAQTVVSCPNLSLRLLNVVFIFGIVWPSIFFNYFDHHFSTTVQSNVCISEVSGPQFFSNLQVFQIITRKLHLTNKAIE